MHTLVTLFTQLLDTKLAILVFLTTHSYVAIARYAYICKLTILLMYIST